MLWFSYEVSSKTKHPNFFRYLTLLCVWRFTNCSIIRDQCMILWKLAFLFAFRLKRIHEVITSWINCIYLINIIRFVNIGPLYATHHQYIKIIDRHCVLSIFFFCGLIKLTLCWIAGKENAELQKTAGSLMMDYKKNAGFLVKLQKCIYRWKLAPIFPSTLLIAFQHWHFNRRFGK